MRMQKVKTPIVYRHLWYSTKRIAKKARTGKAFLYYIRVLPSKNGNEIGLFLNKKISSEQFRDLWYNFDPLQQKFLPENLYTTERMHEELWVKLKRDGLNPLQILRKDLEILKDRHYFTHRGYNPDANYRGSENRDAANKLSRYITRRIEAREKEESKK